jgi:predicted nucleic acid-binding protein
MRAALFDSSIYISGMRRGDDAISSLRRFSVDPPLGLSAVVLEELYAGASGRVRQSLERMERDFDRVKRILVPTLGDWTQAGRVPARLAARDGYQKIGQGTSGKRCADSDERRAKGRNGDHRERARLRQARRISCLPIASGYSLVCVGREY